MISKLHHLPHWGRGVAVLAALAAMQVAQAQYRNSWYPTPVEIANLPEVCQGQFRPELTKDPAYRMPPCGCCFNHFCPGLVAMNRASDVTLKKYDRQVMLNEFRGHYEYTVKNMPPQCTMAPYLDLMRVRLKFLESSLK